MKTNMTGDIHAMRFNVKTSITKVRGIVAKKHTWRRPKIQFMIIIGMQKKNIDIQKYAKNNNQETFEINNQIGIDYQEQE